LENKRIRKQNTKDGSQETEIDTGFKRGKKIGREKWGRKMTSKRGGT
jgi:hypothetical protein